MRNAVRLGRVFGIEIALDYSWFVVFLLVTWSLAEHYLVGYHWGSAAAWAAGLLTSLLFFGCVLAHELGHSLVAQRLGVRVRSITLFIFGGVAQIEREPQSPRDELLITIAGPAVSVVLGILLETLSLLPETRHPAAVLTGWLGWINLSLAAFNMLPGFPLDGGRLLRAAIWAWTGSYQRATRAAVLAGQIVAYSFIILGVVSFFSGARLDALWLAFIGWFLNSAAAGTYQQLLLREQLAGVKARGPMTTDCPAIPRELSLWELVHNGILKSGRRCFPVAEGRRVYGIITLQDVTRVPQPQWPQVAVESVMTPLSALKHVSPETDLYTVMELMTKEDINQVPVLEDGEFVGMVSRDGILAYLAARSELGLVSVAETPPSRSEPQRPPAGRRATGS